MAEVVAGGFGGGGFGNFRNFKPNQPHGAFFWTGGNSALNANPFPFRARPGHSPAMRKISSGSRLWARLTFPACSSHDTKDVLFFTLSGQRSSSPFSQYGSVPTAAEREGICLVSPTGRRPDYDLRPTHGPPFPNNTILPDRIRSQATALLNYIPLPNLPGQLQNYQRLTSSESNTTRVGVRFLHSFGAQLAGGSPIGGLIRQYLGQGGTALRQNVNANFNYSHAAADELNLFPALGGKQQTHQYSLALGYSLGKGRLTKSLTQLEPHPVAAYQLFHEYHRYRQPDRPQRVCPRTRVSSACPTSH